MIAGVIKVREVDEKELNRYISWCNCGVVAMRGYTLYLFEAKGDIVKLGNVLIDKFKPIELALMDMKVGTKYKYYAARNI